MKSKKLYMAKDFGDECETLTDDKRYGESSRPATSKDLTPVAMADMLDHDAENGNWHDFVGCHVKLSQILAREVGAVSAAKIMRKIVDHGGLHGMRES